MGRLTPPALTSFVEGGGLELLLNVGKASRSKLVSEIIPRFRVGRSGTAKVLVRLIPSVSAIRTRSANDRAPIFFMTLPRCTLTVISLTPSSAAICLFIMSGRNEADDLLFSRCQRLETGSYFVNGLVLGAAFTVAFERNLNRIEEILIPERLGEEFDRARLHGAHRHRDIAVSADENDGNLDARLGEFGLKVESAQAGQSDIEHQARGRIIEKLVGFRKSAAEPNTSTRKPTDRSRLLSASRREASSSTTKTIDCAAGLLLHNHPHRRSAARRDRLYICKKCGHWRAGKVQPKPYLAVPRRPESSSLRRFCRSPSGAPNRAETSRDLRPRIRTYKIPRHFRYQTLTIVQWRHLKQPF